MENRQEVGVTRINQRQFDYRRIAEGYAKDRPFLHGHVMEMVKAKLQLDKNFTNGLDIGCGAGLSTKALHMICDRVTGTDISPEMIQAAKALYNSEGYCFRTCRAEEIDTQPKSIDIVTAAGVINWVDEAKFLPHLQKILTDQGLLLIYDFWITDEMEGNTAYTNWWHKDYLPQFPKPERKENKWTDHDIKKYGFRIEAQEDYTISVDMDMAYFIRFMLLQSNVIAQVEEQGKEIDAVRAWFADTLAAFWGSGAQRLIFRGYNWYIVRG